MSTSREDIVNAVKEYSTTNKRPCPAKHLVSVFGADVLDVIVEMKKDGVLLGKRGRTGGLVVADNVEASASPTV